MAGDVYKIQDKEIKPDALYNAVLADSDGAVTTFAGVVRDNTKGRGTSYLVYDAYRDMAEKKMREIGDEVKEKWEVDCVGILHRVGTVGNWGNQRANRDFFPTSQSVFGSVSLRD